MKIGIHNYDDIDPEDRAALRRFYRKVRIAVYANSEYLAEGPQPPESCYQGCYGMDRGAAREWIEKIADELNWLTYLGSK